MTTESLRELDQEQLKGMYEDAFNTRFLLMEMNVDASNVSWLINAIDLEGSKRFGDYWKTK